MFAARADGQAWIPALLLASQAQVTFQSNPPNLVEGCYRALHIDNASYCPHFCPVRSECAVVSTVQCVRAADCKAFHTGGAAVNGVCVTCKVPGCATCASNTKCQTCMDAFNLQDDGTCIWRHYWHWAAILGIVCSVVIWMFVEFAVAHLRPITNKEALTLALQNRSRTKVRDESKPDHPFYPLTAAMHTQPICGPGMPIFMNWFIFVMAVALWQIILSAVFWPSDATFDSLDNLCAVLRASSIAGDNLTETKFDVDKKLASAYFEDLAPWAILSYAGTIVIFVVFQFLQRHLWNKMQAGSAVRPMLHRYAIEAYGFPSDATDSAELGRYWQGVLEALAEDCNGVAEISTAYSFCDKQDEVSRLIEQHLEEEEQRISPQSEIVPQDAEQTIEKEFEPSMPINRPGPFWVQAICFVLLGTDFEVCGLQLKGWSAIDQQEKMSMDHQKDILNNMQTSGCMIVAFKTLKQQRSVRDRVSMPIKFREEHEISVRQLYEEPQGMIWHCYGISAKTHRFRIYVGVLVMSATLALWVVLYYPWSKFTKESIGTVSYLAIIADLLISLTIPIGNALVAYAAAGLVDYYGFRHNAHRLIVYVIVVVPCLFVNVLSDIVVTMRNTILGLNESLSDSPNFLATFGVRAIVKEMFLLLFPGYSLIPYMGEPVACVLLPLFAGIWRIKQDSRIKTQYAKQLMLPGEIDIVNPPYGDIVASSATFMFTFLAPSREHWKIFIAYFIFGAFLYLQNRYRILRWQMMTYFGTIDSHVAVSHLWGLPLGLLAASCGSHLTGDSKRATVLGILYFFGHNIIHFIFVRYLITWEDADCEETYDEALARHGTYATYRNTNPVEVLKSHSFFMPNEGDRLVFYRVGMTHLQPQRNGSTYQGDEATTDLKSMVQREVQDLQHAVGDAATAIKETIEESIAYAVESTPKRLSDALTPRSEVSKADIAQEGKAENTRRLSNNTFMPSTAEEGNAENTAQKASFQVSI